MRFQLSTVRRDVWWPGRAGPQHGVMTTLLTSFVLVVAGLCAGTGARLLLRRLRRGTRVPPPWCELGVASAWGASGAAAVPVRWLPVLLALGWLAVAAGTVDVLAGRLPDALTLPALPTALLLLVPVGGDAVARGVAGAVVAVAAHAAVHFVAPAAMGGGRRQAGRAARGRVGRGVLGGAGAGRGAGRAVQWRSRGRGAGAPGEGRCRAARPVDAPGLPARGGCRCAGSVRPGGGWAGAALDHRRGVPRSRAGRRARGHGRRRGDHHQGADRRVGPAQARARAQPADGVRGRRARGDRRAAARADPGRARSRCGSATPSGRSGRRSWPPIPSTPS